MVTESTGRVMAVVASTVLASCEAEAGTHNNSTRIIA
ncbi:MAG: hypothetical protein A4E49_00127 [Methanosaeta sp. PtaU1.Bin112]|nr:MAG: hypothetical protein A4E49_00127 [Methanosaeta sp. PtaU1.Bin112]